MSYIVTAEVVTSAGVVETPAGRTAGKVVCGSSGPDSDIASMPGIITVEAMSRGGR